MATVRHDVLLRPCAAMVALNKTRVKNKSGSSAFKFQKRIQTAALDELPKSRRLRGNVDGKLYVDNTCIDCDTCRWMAPDFFSRDAGVGQSVVHAQPGSAEQADLALKALISCPTASIRLEKTSSGPEDEFLTPQATKEAMKTFPNAVDAENLAGVYHLGFHSKKSFGATSYLIQTQAHGNIMVDCPRYNPVLAEGIKKLGGVDYIFLTHKDDVGDHARWAQEFGATRIIHELEVRKSQGTDECEVKLSGAGKWKLSSTPQGDEFPATGNEQEEAAIMFTPGHSSGSLTLALRSNPDQEEGRKANALFTGDHLALSGSLGRLTLFERHNHHSLSEQLKQALNFKQVELFESMEQTWLLPGHGRRQYFASYDAWTAALDELARAY